MSRREKSTLETSFDPDREEREKERRHVTAPGTCAISAQMKSLGIIRSERARQEAIKTNRSAEWLPLGTRDECLKGGFLRPLPIVHWNFDISDVFISCDGGMGNCVDER